MQGGRRAVSPKPNSHEGTDVSWQGLLSGWMIEKCVWTEQLSKIELDRRRIRPHPTDATPLKTQPKKQTNRNSNPATQLQRTALATSMLGAIDATAYAIPMPAQMVEK